MKVEGKDERRKGKNKFSRRPSFLVNFEPMAVRLGVDGQVEAGLAPIN